MGESLQKMQDVAREIEQINTGSDDAANELGQKVPQFTAAAQEFSFVSQNFNTAINALGEGLKAAARMAMDLPAETRQTGGCRPQTEKPMNYPMSPVRTAR